MPNVLSHKIAEALIKKLPPQQGEPGLESPFGQRLLENAAIAAGGYGMGQLGGTVAQVLASRGVPAMQALGEAGAIFPEGTSLIGRPKAEIQELQELLTPSQMNYRRNEALADWHARNADFPRVLKDKWAMLVHQHGN